MKPINWDEWTDISSRVFKIIRLDGTAILTRGSDIVEQSNNGLRLLRMFVRTSLLDAPNLAALPSEGWFHVYRCFAPGSWLEYEDVSDRVAPADVEEIPSEGPRLRSRSGPQAEQQLRPPSGSTHPEPADGSPNAGR